MNLLSPFPLCWPAQRPRTRSPEPGRTKVTLAAARKHLLTQLEGLGVVSMVITSNAALRKDGLPLSKQPKLTDVGVAVWFKRPLTADWLCASCDLYDTLVANLRAIGLAIAELRGFTARLGIQLPAAMAYFFTTLPPSSNTQPPPPKPKQEPPPTPGQSPWPVGDWRRVLELGKVVTWTQTLANYRRLAKKYHPDKPGGNTERFQQLQAAYEAAKKQFKFE